MSAIDWQADLEQKVANLLRAFDKEVRAHGDELLVRVTVETTPVKKVDKASPVPTTKKKKVTDESGDEAGGDDSGDD